jgi:hypothetical protein
MLKKKKKQKKKKKNKFLVGASRLFFFFFFFFFLELKGGHGLFRPPLSPFPPTLNLDMSFKMDSLHFIK